MGLKSLRKALKAVPVDDFEVGDVIRWEMTYDVPQATAPNITFEKTRGEPTVASFDDGYGGRISMPLSADAEKILVKYEPKTYVYAAVKTPNGWYTTSRTSAVPGRMNFQDLVEALSDPRVSNVCLASSWDPVV